MQASPMDFVSYINFSADSSNDDDGSGDSSGVRWTSSMTAQNSSRSTDMAGSSHMDNSRMDNHIRNPDKPRLRLLQRRPISERSNAGRAQKVTQLPPMQRIEVFSFLSPFFVYPLFD